jgi:cell volume regulation protein A
VPIILATFPLVAGVPQASMIFNVVFFIVLSSVLLQGTSIPLVARWLKVDAPFATGLAAGAPEFPAARSHTSELMEFRIPPASRAVGTRLSDLNMPAGALVILVGRHDYSFAPVASTRLEANDTLLVCADRTLAGKVSTILEAPQPVSWDDRLRRASGSAISERL